MPHTMPWSSGCGWNSLHYDTLKHRILFLAIEPNEGNDIYAHTLWAYDPALNQMTRLGGGTNSDGHLIDQDTCPQSVSAAGAPWADDTPTWPGPRHPYQQMAWDAKRNRLWLMGGVCGGYGYPDTYYYDSESEAWTQVQAAHYPVYPVGRSMVYDSDTDALLVYGYDGGASTHDMWIFCPTDGSGMLTATQSAAGCATPDDWSEVPLGNGVVDVDGINVTFSSGAPFDPAWHLGYIFLGAPGIGTNYPVTAVLDANHLTLGLSFGTQQGVPYHVQPPGWSEPGLAYDPITRKVLLYGGGANETWAYDVASKSWTMKHPTMSPPADNYFPQPSLAYDSMVGRLIFHQRTGPGGPSDWTYDPLADTWVEFSSGTGWYVADAQAQASPLSTPQVMVHDPMNNFLVGWAGGNDMWVGMLGDVTTAVDASVPDASLALDATGPTADAASADEAGIPMQADASVSDAPWGDSISGAPSAGAKVKSGCSCASHRRESSGMRGSLLIIGVLIAARGLRRRIGPHYG
jgi:hypothetical protein